MAQPDRPSFREASTIVPDLEKAFLDFNAVEERLVEAMGVLLRSHDRERGWLHAGTLSIWRQYRPEHGDAEVLDKLIRSCATTRAEVERADQALGWVVAAVPQGLARRVLGAALMQLALGDAARIEWPAVRRRLGADGAANTTDGLRMRYNRAITAICIEQNARTSGA